MESINVLKGYDRVANLSSEHSKNPSPNTYKKDHRKVIAIIFIISFTLILCALIGLLIHESTTEPSEAQESSSESLKTICAVTQYPDSCFSSISSLNYPPAHNPFQFFNLSIRATVQEVKALTSYPKNLISKSNDKQTESALKDCRSLFDDSLSQLERSFELMKGEKVVLTEMKISDMQTWISAAMTDQETCLDGLGEMGSTVADEFRVKVQRSQQYMSNTLAILNNIQDLFKRFGLTMP